MMAVTFVFELIQLFWFDVLVHYTVDYFVDSTKKMKMKMEFPLKKKKQMMMMHLIVARLMKEGMLLITAKVHISYMHILCTV